MGFTRLQLQLHFSDRNQKLLDDSGLSADQLRQVLHAQLTQLMKGEAEPYSVSYRYDSGGRLIHTARRIFNHEDEIDTTYNENEDTESEITRSTRPEEENKPTAPGPLSSYAETRYSYQYDQHGNWTEKTVSYRSSSDSGFQSSTVMKRSLTYY